ncbi:cytochrome b [Paraburkholderia pallida]|uniref:Cytochrome b n=1 Tax=Paraburkholderia pallida TaxID=2547399 RepID=A0A4P7CSX2_9BURK|nr:cytochrome b [Paraburkholderia pallida]QBQ99035.1 cytochrome b [Paraburkholderia pallida]
MKTPRSHFSALSRLLHWSMAVLIVTMLFVGVGMVSTVSRLHNTLLALHRPLGIALLVLVIVRLAVRLLYGAPKLPADMPAVQRLAAHGSHLVLYLLMIAMPLIGWSMLSAGGYPIVLAGGVHLPPIAPHSVVLYAWLRAAHTWLAMALYATILLHVAAALFHALIRRDGVFASMARG